MPQHVRVFTGPDRWMLQDEDGNVYWVDLWAVEAIAQMIRHVDNLGARYKITLEPMEPNDH